ncbi:MAG: portal protein, partial [Pseudomonadota bacterium]|nr:portal protein [Pseudomonadota bacterium]
RKAHEIFRNWYVDGRVYYHKVIDLDKPSEGIKEVRHMDAMKVKYMRVLKKEKGTDLQIAQNYVPGRNNTISLKDPEIDEFFAFSPDKKSIHSNAQKTIKIAPDAVTYITSGLVDRNKHLTLSYLHKAIKGLNQLRMIEDALVIYRLSRAPERRIFYIDVGNLPKVKSEQYLRDVMNRYRNKLVYDANTGE